MVDMALSVQFGGLVIGVMNCCYFRALCCPSEQSSRVELGSQLVLIEQIKRTVQTQLARMKFKLVFSILNVAILGHLGVDAQSIALSLFGACMIDSGGFLQCECS